MSRLEKLLKLAAAEPDDAFLQYGLGLEYAQLERWQEALDAFDQALILDPNLIAAFHQKSRAELKLGRRDAAKATLANGVAVAQAQGQTHAANEMGKMLEALQ